MWEKKQISTTVLDRHYFLHIITFPDFLPAEMKSRLQAHRCKTYYYDGVYHVIDVENKLWWISRNLEGPFEQVALPILPPRFEIEALIQSNRSGLLLLGNIDLWDTRIFKVQLPEATKP